MEASSALSLHSCSLVGFEKARRKVQNTVKFSEKWTVQGSLLKFNSLDLRFKSVGSNPRLAPIKVFCCCKNAAASALESESFKAFEDEALILKKKSKEVAPYLDGCCIYLVGMMGSGKTTVGKILSEVLGYYYFDSDKLVEQAVGGTSVAQIFKEHSEDFFRENEELIPDHSCIRNLAMLIQRLICGSQCYLKKGAGPGFACSVCLLNFDMACLRGLHLLVGYCKAFLPCARTN